MAQTEDYLTISERVRTFLAEPNGTDELFQFYLERLLAHLDSARESVLKLGRRILALMLLFLIMSWQQIAGVAVFGITLSDLSTVRIAIPPAIAALFALATNIHVKSIEFGLLFRELITQKLPAWQQARMTAALFRPTTELSVGAYSTGMVKHRYFRSIDRAAMGSDVVFAQFFTPIFLGYAFVNLSRTVGDKNVLFWLALFASGWLVLVAISWTVLGVLVRLKQENEEEDSRTSDDRGNTSDPARRS